LALVEKSITVVEASRRASAEAQLPDHADEARKSRELVRLQAETRHLNAVTLKTYLEAAHRLVWLIVSVSLGVSILIGTVRISKVEISPEKQEITVSRLAPKSALSAHLRQRSRAVGSNPTHETAGVAPNDNEK
jgi:hypothetical protein